MAKRILIDTNVYSAFKRNDAGVIAVLRKVEYIGVSVIVLGELIGGFQYGGRARKNIDELEQFLDSPRVYVIDVDEETAGFYADIYKMLRQKGKPVPSNDMWVAASAMRHGLSLFTLDDHFNHINGLSLQYRETGG